MESDARGKNRLATPTKSTKSKSPVAPPSDVKEIKKKKKGIFGGLFKKGKKDGKRSTSNGRSLRASGGRSMKNNHTEASI
jgi:hypothetical protein